MKDLKLVLSLENIEKNINEFIDSEAFHYNECYPLVFDDPIYEGLIRSYGHELLIKRLCKDYGDYIEEIEIINNADNIKSLELKMKDEFFDSGLGRFENEYDAGPFETILNIFGWYISKRINNIIYIEPKYSDDVTDKVYKADYVFHVTFASKLKSILKNGLNPKQTENRYYSHRIYLTYGDEKDYESIKEYSKSLAKLKRINRE